MLDPKLLLVADTTAAMLFALGFLVAWLIDRRLGAFRWWAACYALLAVPIGTEGLRVERIHVGVEAVSWISLYVAIAFVVFGAYKEGETAIRPHLPIALGAVLLAAIIATLGYADASPALWSLWGIVPALALAVWSAGGFLRQGPFKPADLAYAAAISAGVAVIVARALWFADLMAAPKDLLFFSVSFIDEALIMSLMTIFVMVVVAIALILRVALATIAAMSERSSHDGMTGLLNRAAFDERVEQVLRTLGHRELSAIMLDIDLFKRVNDTYGHAAGDVVIARLGAIMRELTGEHQIAGRVGGEEFAVILPDADLAAARLLANAIRTGLASQRFADAGDFAVTLSAGIAQRHDDEPMHALIARADKALYAAKNSGRNRVMVAAPEVDTKVHAQTA